MAREVLTLEINERGALVVVRRLQDVGKAGAAAGKEVNILRSALKTLVGVGIVSALLRASKSIIEMADAFTYMQNRLQLVTKSYEELITVQDELFKIANETRSSFEATAQMFSRTALSVKSLGLSQQQTLNFTKSLNQAIILSGAGGVEAHQAMIQLSQGLASGTLRGDELRSVLEQLPMVADIIAKQMGITRGELKKAGEEGKITGDVIVKAFQAAEGELGQKFAKTVPTVAQSVTVLRNNFVKLVGDLNTTNGGTQTLARQILDLANGVMGLKDDIQGFIDVVAALSGWLKDLFTPMAIGLASVQVDWMAYVYAFVDGVRVILAGIDIIVGGVLGIGNALWMMAQSVKDPFSVTGKDVGDAFMQGLNQSVLLGGFDKAIDQMLNAEGERARKKAVLTKLGDKVDLNAPGQRANLPGKGGKGDESLARYLRNLQREADLLKMTNRERELAKNLWGAEDAAKRSLTTAEDGLVRRLTEEILTREALNKFNETLTELDRETQLLEANAQVREQRKAIMELEVAMGQSLTDNQRDVLEQTLAMNDALKLQNEAYEKIRGNKDAYASQLDALNQLQEKGKITTLEHAVAVRDLNVSQMDAYQRLERSLKAEQDELRVNNSERARRVAIMDAEYELGRSLTDQERRNIEALQAQNEALKLQNDLYEEIRGPFDAFTQQRQALLVLLDQEKISIDEYQTKIRELESALQDTGSVAYQLGQWAGNSFKTMFDMLGEAAAGGIVTFRQFADSVLSDLMRIASQQIMLNLIKGISSGGGVGGAIVNLFGAANGASFEVAGAGGTDSQLVAFKATPGERVNVETPGQARASNAQAAPPVINIINVTDPDEVAQAMASAKGEQIIVNVITKNRNTVRQALS